MDADFGIRQIHNFQCMILRVYLVLLYFIYFTVHILTKKDWKEYTNCYNSSRR